MRLATLATDLLMAGVRSTCAHAAVTALGLKGQLALWMALTFVVLAMMATLSQMAGVWKTSVHAAMAQRRKEQPALQTVPAFALAAMMALLSLMGGVFRPAMLASLLSMPLASKTSVHAAMVRQSSDLIAQWTVLMFARLATLVSFSPAAIVLKQRNALAVMGPQLWDWFAISGKGPNCV